MQKLLGGNGKQRKNTDLHLLQPSDLLLERPTSQSRLGVKRESNLDGTTFKESRLQDTEKGKDQGMGLGAGSNTDAMPFCG